MYDTINLWLPMERTGETDLFTRPDLYLSNIARTDIERTGQVYISGYLGNYKVNLSEQGISLKGSLAKYYLGDNIQNLTRGDTQRAIEKMGDLLHLPIYEAKVTRLDLAQNIVVKYPVSTYYNYLGECQHYKRLTYQQSIAYQNGLRYKTFYDKIAEAKKDKRVQIPEVYLNTNLLRYELRFKKRLPKHFNIAEITATTLFKETFYIDAINKWENEYICINKIREIGLNFKMINTKKQYAKQGILCYVQQKGGELDAIQEIQTALQKGELTKKQAYDLREQVKNACNDKFLTIESDLIAELDKKIKDAVRYYR